MELQKENKYYVYALIDPINRTPFYIGKGCGNRAYSHLKMNQGNVEKNKLINSIYNLGLEPKVEFIVENLDEKTAYDIEYIIIKNSKYYGINLTNKVGIFNPPSRKNSKMPESVKNKISAALKHIKKHPLSESTKKKISESNKGKVGPNKKIIQNVNLLRDLYVNKNHTKEELMKYFNVGLFSLNRILSENQIKKTKENFSDYGKKNCRIKFAKTLNFINKKS